jgi:hypothetical protein
LLKKPKHLKEFNLVMALLLVSSISPVIYELLFP